MAILGAQGVYGSTVPEARLATALKVGRASILDAAEIEVDGRVVGVFGRRRLGDDEVAALVSIGDGRSFRLGAAGDVWFAGLVDLSSDTRLPQGRRLSRRLKAEGLGRPALVLLTRHVESIEPGVLKGLAGGGRSGKRESTHLFVVSLGPALRVLLELEIRYRTGDGYGGYDVGGLTLRQESGETYLVGTRQDHLPASRARCRRPEPYPIRFELAADWFRELTADPSPVPCGPGG
jgi:hypothetical protein